VQDKEGQAVLEPATELPSQRPASVVGYNPRHNMIASAEKEVLFWVPDPE
jgi:COMPASS component SWD2